MDLSKVLLVLYIIGLLSSTFFLIKGIKKKKDELHLAKGGFKFALIGFYTNFFDTWGIGSFAPTIASWRFLKAPIEETHFPGTLNFGDAFPVTVEAICFLSFVDIDGLTLFLMVIAASIGAWVGVGIVSKLDIQKIRIAMAVCLIATAFVMFCKVRALGPFTGMGEALALTGVKLVIGVVINFFLGALMMIGFGLYIPCTAVISVLGMSIGAAFPIMMGSCCLLMNVSVPKWYETGAYDINATIHCAVFGSIGAFVAFLLTKYAFNMTTLSYLMCIVMIITGIMYARDFANGRKSAA